ncbi:transporter, partial [Glaesserella parasuis]|nr:transporter [Glaesserella parasuis]
PVSLEAQQLASSFHFNEATNTLSTTLINPNEAVTLLTDFIAFSTLQTRADLNTELITKWKVLFQQVKQLAETSTGTAQQEWTTKLNLMRSVQPLDNQLTAYRLVKSP